MIRVGVGYDVHRLVEDRKLILGGVVIPFEKGLLGHSDADVLVHAIMDATLGALALGDLGQHFPDTDSQYAGASSLDLLEQVRIIIDELGWEIGNVDSVIVAEKPRLASFCPQMRENVARTFKAATGQISIKATTTEGLGFAGTGEGIAAYAVVSVVRSSNSSPYIEKGELK
jgi:2-C-methyl-D-erythritol 2,4-cyclodiphosphate synthase